MAAYDSTTRRHLWTVPSRDDYRIGRPVLDQAGTVISIEAFRTFGSALLEAATGRILRLPFSGAGCLSPRGEFRAGGSHDLHGLGFYSIGVDTPLVVMELDDVVDSCYQTQFSREGRHVAWPSRESSIYVADIPEVRRRLNTLGLGW